MALTAGLFLSSILTTVTGRETAESEVAIGMRNTRSKTGLRNLGGPKTFSVGRKTSFKEKQ
jgi:hypothetical protein